MQTFYQYVLNTMSAADFNSLPTSLGLSQSKTTRRLKNPCAMDISTIQKIAKLLKRDVQDLVEEYEMGYDNLTYRQVHQLINPSS